jgi:TonB family protein
MTETWKRFEGHVINGRLRTNQYLGGSESSGVFLADCGVQGPRGTVIRLVSADPAEAERRLSRWRLAAEFLHPHILRLFRMGRCRLDNMDLLFVAMEYAEEDLAQILPTRPLTPSETRDMLVPTLDALAYIHSKGFVHGHLKPSNIMAAGDQLKISSDGLERAGEPSSGARKASDYDPPEAARGVISPAGDAWSLGMTLVEALTQHLPEWKESQPGDPVLPDAVPEPFLDIARHCLIRDSQSRWTIARIKERLQSEAAPKGPRIRRPGTSNVLWRFVIPSLVTILTLLAILVGISLFKSGPEIPHAAPIAAEVSKASSPKEEPPPKPGTGLTTQRAEEKWQTPAADSRSSPEALPETRAASRDLVPGEVAYQVVPDVSQKALDTIRGTIRIRVRVSVDPSGSVTEATLDSPGPSKYFADLVLRAAQQWEFAPAKLNGQNAPSAWILEFELVNTGVKVFPTRAAS